MAKKVNPDQERALNKTRCSTCGKWHPFIAICPYIKSVRVEQIRDLKNPGIRGRITVTEYFERKELLESAIESMEEAEKIADDPSI